MERYGASGICVGSRWAVDGIETDDQSSDDHVGISRGLLEDQYDCAGRVSRGRFARGRRRIFSRRANLARGERACCHATVAGLRLNLYVRVALGGNGEGIR